MNLYEVMTWGNEEDEDGVNASLDTGHFVYAETPEEAARLIDPLFKYNDRIKTWSTRIYLWIENCPDGRSRDSTGNLVPWISGRPHLRMAVMPDGFRCWRREEESGPWEEDTDAEAYYGEKRTAQATSR